MEIISIIGVVIVLFTFIQIESALERRSIELCHYHIKNQKLSKNTDIRLLVVADLHSKDYGDNNAPLIHLIKEESPQAILIPGDMIVGKKRENVTTAVNLIKELNRIAPVYYSLGNHEQRMKSYAYDPESKEYETVLDLEKDYISKYNHYINEVKAAGAIILDNENLMVKINEEEITITGLSIPLSYFEKFNYKLMETEEVSSLLGSETGAKENLQILLAHNPVHMEAYTKWGADLVVSGHLHGGIIRLPFIGGLITPQVKLFPRYHGGLYRVNKKTAVVSRGLGEHTVNIRVFNSPEVSVIHLRGE